MRKKKIDRKASALPEFSQKKSLIDLKYLIAILFFVFCFLLYKNISYPLLWNDESDTAMTATQVLKYGYPKVHDEKNIIFLPDDPSWIGYKKSYDMNIARTWGDFYFATIGVALAEHVDDIYLKSALVRIPFATAGLAGLIIFVVGFRRIFNNKSSYEKFVAAFILIELCSVALFLHIRTVRYYALLIFITACFFYVFIQYFLNNRYSFKKYLILMILVLFFAYQINFVAFPSFCLTIGIYEAFQRAFNIFGDRKDKKNLFFETWRQLKITFKNLSPMLIAVVLISPFVLFFETFENAAKATAYYGLDFHRYLENLKRIVLIFKVQEFFYAAVFVKTLQLIIWYAKRKEQKRNQKESLQEINLEKLSFFMTLFFICFSLMVAKMPLLWERYFIVLQPIMILILLTDTIIIFNYISSHVQKTNAKFMRLAFTIALIISFSINSEAKINYCKSYFYQITHQYKGPLDYLIPYIKANYKHPDSLVIATNYEELSYIYYLGCRVTIGYINKNIQEDLKYQPDIVIFRKKWGHNPQYFNQLVQKAQYKRVLFPVFDYPVNDIAELDYFIQHQFKTRLTDVEADKSEILIRIK
ncbi:MAG: hypothetical protein HY840_03415 [Bacteroidetes bacterium]|nr:hypothetical protein [Bacteroidota bacterium]